MDSYYSTLPTKRMSTGAIFLDERSHILIVKPKYKDHWSLVGGVVDVNESPTKACQREILEEIGLTVNNLRFLCVDYISAVDEKNECLHFIFYGGILNKEDQKQIILKPDELAEYAFLPLEQALPRVSDGQRRRLPICLEAIKEETGFYLENGKIDNTLNTDSRTG